MEITEPTAEELAAGRRIWRYADEKTIRFKVIRQQLIKYCCMYSIGYVHFILNRGKVFFICNDLYHGLYIYYNAGNYCALYIGTETLVPIQPITYIDNECRHIIYDFIKIPELGNALYINDIFWGKRLCALIYFDEPCGYLPGECRYINIGGSFINIYISEDHEIIIVDQHGNMVKYYALLSEDDGKITVHENQHMVVIVRNYETNKPMAQFIAKSGGHTKVAPRLAELSAE